MSEFGEKIHEKIQEHEQKHEEKKAEHAQAEHTHAAQAEHAKEERNAGKDAGKVEAKAPRPKKLPVTDTLSFAIIDLQRGINSLRQNSAATLPGTYIYTSLQYFDAAVARLDHALSVERGPGVKLTEEDRAKERERYQKEYVDPVEPQPAPTRLPGY